MSHLSVDIGASVDKDVFDGEKTRRLCLNSSSVIHTCTVCNYHDIYIC